MSRILWAFDILPATDERGQPILPDWWNYTNGFNSRPVSFGCRFIPRNENTIRAVWQDAKQKQSM